MSRPRKAATTADPDSQRPPLVVRRFEDGHFKRYPRVAAVPPGPGWRLVRSSGGELPRGTWTEWPIRWRAGAGSFYNVEVWRNDAGSHWVCAYASPNDHGIAVYCHDLGDFLAYMAMIFPLIDAPVSRAMTTAPGGVRDALGRRVVAIGADGEGRLVGWPETGGRPAYLEDGA